MKSLIYILFFLVFTVRLYSQAGETFIDEDRKSYVIVILKDGETKNIFKEGKGITCKIANKIVTGTWYFNAEPDLISVVGKKGEVLGIVALNEQKNIKLETEAERQSSGRVSFGVGFGPVGISTGGGNNSARYISYNMSKNKAIFDEKKESREEKIRRVYAEKKQLEEQKKAAAKAARKAKKSK